MTKPTNGRAVVGLDLDGVVADYVAALRPYVAEYTGRPESSLPQPETYNLVKAGWGLHSFEDFIAVHRRAVDDGFLAKMPVIPGAPEAMRALSDAGAHIRVVTHRLIMGGRHLRVVQDTAQWLEDNGFPYMSLCFTGLKDSVGAHVYLEDSAVNVQELREQGYPTIVFDQPYNQGIAGPRITNWEEGVGVVLEELRRQGQLA